MANKNTNLSIYYQNVRGLRTKTNILADISASQHDIVIFTEHWLNDDFSSSEYFDETYFVERDDRISRDKKWGGGALIAIKSNLTYKRVDEWEKETTFENVWIELRSNSSNSKTFVNVVYIPPQSSYDNYSKYFDSLTEIMCVREPNARFIVVGDFNMGASIEWYSENGLCYPVFYDGEIASEFINVLALNDLRQLNSIRNMNGRTLDLVFTNTTEISLQSTQPLSKIDGHHPPFLLNFVTSDLKFGKTNKTIKYNYFKANYQMINNELSQLKWDDLFAGMNLDEIVNKFYEIVQNIIGRYTPVIIPKSDKYPKWFTKKLIDLITEKNLYHDKYKQTGLEIFNILFKLKRRELKYELRANEKKYTDNIESTVKSRQ